MNLIANNCYTNNKTDLKLYIIKVSYYNDTYVKVKGSLLNKFDNTKYETRNYKLYWKNIGDWYICEKE
mgnify:CR=1 FL=1